MTTAQTRSFALPFDEETQLAMRQQSTSFPLEMEADLLPHANSSRMLPFSHAFDRIASYMLPLGATLLLLSSPASATLGTVRFGATTRGSALVALEILGDEWQLVTEPMDRDAFEVLVAMWALPHSGEPPFDFRVE